jgi:hypothetical protein
MLVERGKRDMLKLVGTRTSKPRDQLIGIQQIAVHLCCLQVETLDELYCI